PNFSKGYYGADVSGPVFKDIAHKIYRDALVLEEIDNVEPEFASVNSDYENYYETSLETLRSIPNVKGMAAMDAVSILENLGLIVQYFGNGKVKKQSLKSGDKIIKGSIIKLELS
ncbi:MAG: cell division protein FtsI (penicillin-binding protein 3), partial [Porticoccaceae bacterium]